jgi:hypothetical protein
LCFFHGGESLGSSSLKRMVEKKKWKRRSETVSSLRALVQYSFHARVF